MKYYFKPSFSRHFKKLSTNKQTEVLTAIEALKTVLPSGLPLGGLGLKQLNKNLWEIRSTLKDRIIFTYAGDTVTFINVGNHDDIRKYLKTL
ncbi:MAG: hypothetical protein ABIH50_04900 [bacterium]